MSKELKDESWKVTKEQVIKEIVSTNDAIGNFSSDGIKTPEELESMAVEDLHEELRVRTDKMYKLVKDWDVK